MNFIEASRIASSPRLRIALLANGLFPYVVGGMQKHTTYLARYLARAGVKVDLFYLEDQRHPPIDQIRREQFADAQSLELHAVPYRPLVYFPGHYYFTCWWGSRFFLEALQDSEKIFDFVFAQGYTGWATLSAKKREPSRLPPVGVHAHGIEALQEKRGLLFDFKSCFAPVWQRRVIQLADANLSLGGKLDDLLVKAGVKPEAIIASHNGIDRAWLCDKDRVAASPNTRTKFLFVGRDSERKGFHELNTAVREMLHDARFEMHFVGPISDSLKMESDRLIYHGTVRDEQRLREIYRTCDVLVVPSHSEGMPTVLLEAMASGMAIIATDVGAVRLAVDDSMGQIIPARDSHALRDAMLNAMSTDLTKKKIASREKVEAHLWENVTDTFISSLSTFLATHKS